MNGRLSTWAKRNTSAHLLAEPSASLAQYMQLMPKALQYDLLEFFCCLNYGQRRQFIQETLQRMCIPYRLLHTGKDFHILIEPEQDICSAKDSTYDYQVFVAHYDRRPQTPGANDNSAAVWQLLNLAFQMKRECPVVQTPVQIILTDGEELRQKEAKSNQGAYFLAKYLRKNFPQRKYLFYVFDQCGVGNTLCYLSNLLVKPNLLEEQESVFQQLSSHALKNLPVQNIRNDCCFFSDNLGLSLGGYPALLFSTLPKAEVLLWQEKGTRPASWANIHTHKDTPDLLDAQSFSLISRSLSRIITS